MITYLIFLITVVIITLRIIITEGTEGMDWEVVGVAFHRTTRTTVDILTVDTTAVTTVVTRLHTSTRTTTMAMVTASMVASWAAVTTVTVAISRSNLHLLLLQSPMYIRVRAKMQWPLSTPSIH